MTSKEWVKRIFPAAQMVDRDPIGFTDKVVMVDGVALAPPGAKTGRRNIAWQAARRAIIAEAERTGIALPIPGDA